MWAWVWVCVYLSVNIFGSSSSDKGSYGVVKLAYNEDDNTYYVSQTLSHIMDVCNVLIVPAAPIPIAH